MSQENAVASGEHPQALNSRPDAVAPRVDVYENDAEYLVLADLPGVAQEALSLRLDKRELTLEAQVTPQKGESLLTEFAPTAWRRVFTVPRNVEVDAIGASLNHGVLTLRLPKAERHKPRQIPVRVA
jgi:HSP20 family molecular chaperone IbpA